MHREIGYCDVKIPAKLSEYLSKGEVTSEPNHVVFEHMSFKHNIAHHEVFEEFDSRICLLAYDWIPKYEARVEELTEIAGALEYFQR